MNIILMLFIYSFIGALILLVLIAYALSRKIKKEKIVYDSEQIKSADEYDSKHVSAELGADKPTSNSTEGQRDIQDGSARKPTDDDTIKSGKQSEGSKADKQPSSSVPDPEQVD